MQHQVEARFLGIDKALEDLNDRLRVLESVQEAEDQDYEALKRHVEALNELIKEITNPEE